jgi:hypothetical protein
VGEAEASQPVTVKVLPPDPVPSASKVIDESPRSMAESRPSDRGRMGADGGVTSAAVELNSPSRDSRFPAQG